MAKNEDGLPQRDRNKAEQKMAERRARDEREAKGSNDFSVTNRTGAQRHGHPDGWQTGGRDENG